ncbi:epimerase [Leucobacter albus]|uniref:Epimerase n=1 Tax=Leucobacter albus TaxID=272210 RepID=A0ABW3TUX6_9MICO
MPDKRIVFGGASGFLGSRLRAEFEGDGWQVATIGRSGADATWGDTATILRLVDGADAVIGLAGKSVDCRYTDENRDEILRSRVDTTRALAAAIAASERPPAVWLNASTATIYRHAMDRPQTEASGELGSGFSVDIARNWEREFFEPELPGTRRVALRIAITLGDGPATNMLFRLARLGLGGPQFDGPWFAHRRYRGIGPDPSEPAGKGWHRTRGRQRFSWVHIDDVVGAVRFALGNESLTGPVNVVSPGASDNRTVMRTLRRIVGARIGLPAFRWMLEPATWVLRTESEMVLKSRWVAPETLVAAGYEFRWPELEPALRDVNASRAHGRGLGRAKG